MILLEKRPHLLLKTSLPVVRLLTFDVSHQRTQIAWTDGEQSVPPLPSKVCNALFFHPRGRRRFDLGHNLCSRSGRRQFQSEMDMIGDPAHTEAIAIQFPRRPRKISVKLGHGLRTNQGSAVLCREDDVHQVKAQRLRHAANYMSGLQPSQHTDLGLRPRLICCRAFGPQVLATPSFAGNTRPLQSKPTVSGKATITNSTTKQAPTARQHNSLGRRPRTAKSKILRAESSTHKKPPQNRALAPEVTNGHFR